MVFKGKKVLMMGLGLLGGGVSATNWLLDQGADVTVTDLKDDVALASSVRKVHAHLKKVAADGKAYDESLSRLHWALGGHTDQMIKDTEVIMVNQDVPKSSKYLKLAQKLGKTIANESNIFYAQWKGPIIGITGTRGKTTTVNWCAHLLSGSTQALATGNSTVRPLLSALDANAKGVTAVTEMPSFQLEHFTDAPDIALITNLYRDHLNRYNGMEDYAKTKAIIFKNQNEKQHLILNADDEWTPFFLEQKPTAQIWYVASKPLPGGQGLYENKGWLWFLSDGMAERVIELKDFGDRHGKHNVRNMMNAALAAHLAGAPWDSIISRMDSLPTIPYRQEVVHRSGKLTIINDTTATTPEGTIAALERFGGPNCVLITGGTDRELEYDEFARVLLERIKPENTIFLEGTATKKMLKSLGKDRLNRKTYGSLEQCLKAALKRAGKYVNAVILFSPGAKSFGPFKNEYDRGQRFNKLVKQLV